MSAFHCIGPAWDRMVATCFRPFRWSVWWQLAVVVLLAGEGVGGGGGFNGLNKFSSGSHPTRGVPHLPWSQQQIIVAVAVGAAILVVLMLLFAYLNARARFVLMEAVIERDCRLGEMWRRWREPASDYFSFALIIMVVSVSVACALGITAWRNFAHGHPSAGGLGTFAGLVAFAFVFFLVVALIWLFAKDFVVPIMALERLPLGDAWSRLRAIIGVRPGDFFVYVLARIVLTIAAGILAFMILIPAVIVVALPLGIVAAVFAVAAKGNFLLIGIGVVLAVLIFAPLFVGIIALLNVPFGVFFESFALEFLSFRLPSLGAVLHPLPPPVAPVPEPVNPIIPPAEPSPI